MAASSLSLRFGSSSSSGLHSLLGGGDGGGNGGDYDGGAYSSVGSLSGPSIQDGSGGVGNGGIPVTSAAAMASLQGGSPLMTVDTNHHSLLSSLQPPLPNNNNNNNGMPDYTQGGKMLFLGGGPLGDFGGHHHAQGGYGKEDFDDKFSNYGSSGLQPQSSGPPSSSGSSKSVVPSSVSTTASNPTLSGSSAAGGPKLKTERDISNLQHDLNIVSEGQNDVTIEYMDLDEFLHENGLSNVVKGDDPLSHPGHQQQLGGPNGGPSNALEKHYPVNLQQRGLGGPTNDPEAQQQHLLTPVSSSSSSSSLTCIIPSLGGGGAHGGPRLPPLDVYATAEEHNRQCSPGSSNSLASPSSGCSVGELTSRGRRRSSTKSIDSCRSLSPGTDGGDSLLGSGSKTGLDGRLIKRSKKEMVPDIKKDANYWKKREKNNLAAKRSRDSRREREAQISYKTKFLENENTSLQQKLDKCLRQLEDLKKRLSKYEPL